MRELEKVLKALGDKNRLRILKVLEKRKMCVCEIADILGITQPSVSRHLKKLKDAGLIGGEQDGLWTNYYLKRKAGRYIEVLLQSLKRWLNEDKTIKEDLLRAKKVDRNSLCHR